MEFSTFTNQVGFKKSPSEICCKNIICNTKDKNTMIFYVSVRYFKGLCKIFAMQELGWIYEQTEKDTAYLYSFPPSLSTTQSNI